MKKVSLSPVRALACLLSLLIASFVSLSSVEAATITSWGGNYVSTTPDPGYTSLIGSTTLRGKTLSYDYSLTVAKSPVSEYSGPAIYGGIQTTVGASGTPSFVRYQIDDVSSNDRLRFTGTSGATGERSSLKGLVFFKKADFVNGGAAPGSTVTFDSTSSMSINASALASTTREIRMAVLASVNGISNWYLSETSATGPGVFSITNISSAKWAVWSGVADDSLLPALPSSYSLAGSAFDDITASGFYFSAQSNSSSFAAPTITIDSFTMNANVAIPEPSTVSALLLVGFGGLAWSWKKRAQKRVG